QGTRAGTGALQLQGQRNIFARLINQHWSRAFWRLRSPRSHVRRYEQFCFWSRTARKAFETGHEGLAPVRQFNAMNAQEFGAIEPGIRRPAGGGRILSRSYRRQDRPAQTFPSQKFKDRFGETGPACLSGSGKMKNTSQVWIRQILQQI